jgi:hypothetical protein
VFFAGTHHNSKHHSPTQHIGLLFIVSNKVKGDFFSLSFDIIFVLRNGWVSMLEAETINTP